jgi:hypothetical protein
MVRSISWRGPLLCVAVMAVLPCVRGRGRNPWIEAAA